jgi:hypothetical protein
MAYRVLVSMRMREADHPRFLELVLGRMLELVVYSVEGVRERIIRNKATIH